MMGYTLNINNIRKQKSMKFQRFAFISAFLATLLLLNACTDDLQKSYYDNGKLRSELRYEEGKLHGHCKWYYETGLLQMEAWYEHNMLNGKQVRYHENGNVQSVAFYRENMFDSLYQQFSINGKLLLNEYYLKDTLHGIYQKFYETGQVMVEGTYEKGMMHGRWLFFDNGGKIVGTADFEYGTGIQKGYHANGKLSRVIHYKDNLKHGPEEFYNHEGVLEKVRVFSFGDLVPESE